MKKQQTDEAKQALVVETATRRGVKGNGWIAKRGKFYTAYWKFNGKLHKRTTKQTNEAKAREVLAQFVAPYQAKRNDADVDAVALALGQVGERNARLMRGLPALKVRDAHAVLSELPSFTKLSPATREGYRLILGAFATWLKTHRDGGEDMEMRSVSVALAREYLVAKRANGVTPQTRRHILINLRGAWAKIRKAEEERALDDSVVDKTTFCGYPVASLTSNPWIDELAEPVHGEKTALNVAHRHPLTIEQMRKLVATAQGEMKILFMVGAFCGARLGDAARLKFGENVRLDELAHGRLVIVPEKTGVKSRAFVNTGLTRELHDALAKLPQAKTDGAYVTPSLAEAYNRSASILSRMVQRVFAEAGVVAKDRGTANVKSDVVGKSRAHRRAVYGFHSFRYSVAAIKSADSIESARDALAHSSADMTRAYANGGKSDDACDAEATRMGEVLNGTPSPSRSAFKALATLGSSKVSSAQKAVYDAVVSMLGGLEASTLRAVAYKALTLSLASARATEAEAQATTVG